MFEAFIQIHAQNKFNGTLLAADGTPIPFRQIDPDKSEALLGLQFEVMEDVIEGARAIRILMSYRADRYSPARVRQIEAEIQQVCACFVDPANRHRPLSELE